MSFRRIFYCRRVSSTKRGGMTKDRDPPTKFIKLEIIASVLLGCVVEGIRVGVSNLALASFRDGHSAVHLATTATTTATATATTRTTTTTTRTTTTTATTTTGTGTGAGTANANWNANPPGQQQEHLHQHILLPLLLLRLLSSRCCNSSVYLSTTETVETLLVAFSERLNQNFSHPVLGSISACVHSQTNGYGCCGLRQVLLQLNDRGSFEGSLQQKP